MVGVLERLEDTRGLPEVITVDNGPEFAGKVMDDYSRFILAHRLQRDMTSDSFIEVHRGGAGGRGQDRHGSGLDNGQD